MLHWTAGDYATIFPAYHFCLSGPAAVRVHPTHDLRANMRDVHGAASGSYAAHTAGRNSFCAGIAICAMQTAEPHDFGATPLTSEQIDALCTVTAALVRHYAIPLANVRTHAEAAVDDGYFGAADDERWDIARLAPASAPLVPGEAAAIGEQLRRQIAGLL
jgi:hypothetical protein